ncbi:unnamed protein product [Malus baccata var. baccata]
MLNFEEEEPEELHNVDKLQHGKLFLDFVKNVFEAPHKIQQFILRIRNCRCLPKNMKNSQCPRVKVIDKCLSFATERKC